jgi:periplasmic protein TonB
MFEDFAISPGQLHTQQRFRRSFAIAFAVYGTAGAALVSASNTARTLIKESLVQVAFTPPPEVKPEPPPPPEAPNPKSARAGVSQRKALKPPDEVPDKKPPESNAPLVQPTGEGPQDGVLGVVGGTGTDSVNSQPAPPPQIVPAKELAGNRQPPYPKRAERDGIEGEVLVAFDVLEDGRVVNPKIVKGPADFHEAVLQVAVTWRYRPATLAGKPVKHRCTKLVRFQLED